MIAWGIYIQRMVFGESEFALKLLPMMIYPFTSLVVYFIAKSVYDNRTSRYAALLFLTSPAVSLASMMVTTDVFLVMFWSLAVWCLVLALQQRRLDLWLWVGFFSGCGLLTKYTMLLFLPSFALYLALSKQLKLVVASPGVALAFFLALALIMPNLYWNYLHDMVSFRHLFEISQIENKRYHISQVFYFVGSQVGILGLGTSYLFVRYCLCSAPRFFKDRYCLLWFCFFFVYLAVISFQAFISRAFPNWAAPCYVTAVVWLSHVIMEKKKPTLLNMAILINLLSMSVFYHYETIYAIFDIPLTYKIDPKRHTRGWSALGSAVTTLMHEHSDCLILADNRRVLSELIYYVRPHPMHAKLFNPKHQLKNTFHLSQDLNENRGDDFIWVTNSHTPEVMLPYFQSMHYIQTIVIPVDERMTVYTVFRLNGFNGY